MTQHDSIAPVQFTPQDLAWSLMLAAQRHAIKSSITDRWTHPTVSGWGVHLVGVLGELAVARVYGGKINQDIALHGDRHQPDIIIRDGRRVEVKASMWKGDDIELKVEDDGELTGAEWFCLVRIPFVDRADVFPLISQEKFRQHHIVKRYPRGDRMVMTGHDILCCAQGDRMAS